MTPVPPNAKESLLAAQRQSLLESWLQSPARAYTVADGLRWIRWAIIAQLAAAILSIAVGFAVSAASSKASSSMYGEPAAAETARMMVAFGLVVLVVDVGSVLATIVGLARSLVVPGGATDIRAWACISMGAVAFAAERELSGISLIQYKMQGSNTPQSILPIFAFSLETVAFCASVMFLDALSRFLGREDFTRQARLILLMVAGLFSLTIGTFIALFALAGPGQVNEWFQMQSTRISPAPPPSGTAIYGLLLTLAFLAGIAIIVVRYIMLLFKLEQALERAAERPPQPLTPIVVEETARRPS